MGLLLLLLRLMLLLLQHLELLHMLHLLLLLQHVAGGVAAGVLRVCNSCCFSISSCKSC